MTGQDQHLVSLYRQRRVAVGAVVLLAIIILTMRILNIWPFRTATGVVVISNVGNGCVPVITSSTTGAAVYKGTTFADHPLAHNVSPSQIATLPVGSYLLIEYCPQPANPSATFTILPGETVTPSIISSGGF